MAEQYPKDPNKAPTDIFNRWRRDGEERQKQARRASGNLSDDPPDNPVRNPRPIRAPRPR